MMLYLRSRAGLMQAIRDARTARATFPRARYIRHVAADGAFCFSIWQGACRVGTLAPAEI
ncbi:hypothetical protein PQI07_22735 [Methylobacterium sp. 092160098-2]|uniref:hypothetical protein n=1 Tax=Methylobacterium sp. 092160098-2 TaxID=3025129 RepID=UPI0023819879|nr:hypothetical protein [Methylobacterium sp. 092160098-2]MDE4913501.1 hypothetical protein [Methylobacterium sp. 092160098-2]